MGKERMDDFSVTCEGIFTKEGYALLFADVERSRKSLEATTLKALRDKLDTSDVTVEFISE